MSLSLEADTSGNHYLIVEADHKRRVIQLKHKVYSLGRSVNCDIQINSQFVSRKHATLFRRERDEGETYYQILDGDISGQLSANGLSVNNRKVPTKDLVHGDKLLFGRDAYALYQCRLANNDSQDGSEDPFDITLIDPAMIEDEADKD
ncbi:MAG: FHA domain-containing protein [Cyanobacteria bacterium P01_H01_bin.15]